VCQEKCKLEHRAGQGGEKRGTKKSKRDHRLLSNDALSRNAAWAKNYGPNSRGREGGNCLIQDRIGGGKKRGSSKWRSKKTMRNRGPRKKSNGKKPVREGEKKNLQLSRRKMDLKKKASLHPGGQKRPECTGGDSNEEEKIQAGGKRNCPSRNQVAKLR